MNVNNVDWDDLISSSEATKIFNVSDGYFKQLVRRKKITEGEDFKKIGTSLVYSRKALEYFFFMKENKKNRG